MLNNINNNNNNTRKVVSVGGCGLPRNKIGKGVAKKRLRAALVKARTTPSHPSPAPRADEDSGFGGEEEHGETPFLLDSSSQRSPCSEPRSPQSVAAQKPPQNSPTSSGPSSAQNSVSKIILPSFGMAKEIYLETGPGIPSKKLRLDMTEEANELPEEGLPAVKCQGESSTPKIVSFKNVPGLIFPANAVQVQSATLLSLPHHPPPTKPTEARVPEPIVLKQRVATGAVRGSSKVEKLSKKVKKSHVLEGNLPSVSSDGTCELQLLSQPEGQHRARYQTEGSRGAVKDRVGNGHPSVKLKGYDKTALLQVFVASDGAQGGTVTPHLFYQACKVSGKNSTPCKEDRIHGTNVLEILMHPDKDMTVSCDCVGILKERNVDVEQRMKSFVSRGKKKSTKCRLVFRTSVTLSTGEQEILQVVSQPISCTQPPGIPEICRKSLLQCSVDGEDELFIIGKNFYKDTEVIFKEMSNNEETKIWSHTVSPEKDYLQSNHLICQIPPYHDKTIKEEVEVLVQVVSCGKFSDPHTFTYLPLPQKRGNSPKVSSSLPLPKGVSPNAVKLNQLYAESGGGLPLSTPEYNLLSVVPSQPVTTSASCNSVVPTSLQKPLRNNNYGLSRERFTPQHSQVSRALATVNPQIQTTSSLVTKFPQKNYHSNTFTTATVQTPKPSPNSVPSQLTANATSALFSADAKRENVLENLIQMLKLLKTIPGNLHNPIVDLVADEILRQVKREGVGEKRVTQKEASQNAQNNSLLVGPNSESQIGLSSGKENFVDSTRGIPVNSTCPISQTNAETSNEENGNQFTQINSTLKMYSSNNFSESVNELQPNIQVESLSGNSSSISVLAEMDSTSHGTTTKVTCPLSGLISAKGDYVNSRLNTSTNEIIGQTVCSPTTQIVFNGNEHLTQNPKFSYITYTPNQQSCLNIEQPQNSTASSVEHNSHQAIELGPSFFENNYKITQTTRESGINFKIPEIPHRTTSLHSVQNNNNKVKVEEIFQCQNMMNKQTILPQNRYSSLEKIEEDDSIETSAVFKMEDCDPLLSQANAVPTMTLNTTDEIPLTLRTPVESSIGIHNTDGTSIAQPITSSASSDVPIAQLSENDLLNYINPTCFDNV